jgi:hypothetical protein
LARGGQESPRSWQVGLAWCYAEERGMPSLQGQASANFNHFLKNTTLLWSFHMSVNVSFPIFHYEDLQT